LVIANENKNNDSASGSLQIMKTKTFAAGSTLKNTWQGLSLRTYR